MGFMSTPQVGITPKNNTKIKKHVQAKCYPSDMVNPSLIDVVDTYRIKQIQSRRKGLSVWQIGVKGAILTGKGGCEGY